MGTRILFLLSLCCVFVFLLAQHGYGAIYKYVDKDGVISFANDLQSIPEQYRVNAKVVSDASDQENSPLMENGQTRGQTGKHEDVSGMTHDNAVDSRLENSFFKNRMLLTALVIVSAGFAFIIMGILETDHKKTVAITRVALVWAVALYLLIAHAGDAVRMFRTVGGTIDEVKHQSAERGKKAAKAAKALRTFVDQVGEVSSTAVPEEVHENKE
jgi:Domain of unknown function (DUF4124)